MIISATPAKVGSKWLFLGLFAVFLLAWALFCSQWLLISCDWGTLLCDTDTIFSLLRQLFCLLRIFIIHCAVFLVYYIYIYPNQSQSATGNLIHTFLYSIKIHVSWIIISLYKRKHIYFYIYMWGLECIQLETFAKSWTLLQIDPRNVLICYDFAILFHVQKNKSIWNNAIFGVSPAVLPI